MKTQAISPSRAVILGVLSLLPVFGVFGQERKPTVKVGDKVEAQVLGEEWKSVKVLEVLPTGWCKVEFFHAGRRIEPAMPPHKIRVGGALLAVAPVKSTRPGVSSDEVRQWKSNKGTPLFSARVKDYAAGGKEVSLEKPDRTVVKLKIEEISPDDRKYLFGLLKSRKR